MFVVDKIPRGIGHELVATLEQLRRAGTKCVLGLRDVLDEPHVVAREWLRDSNDEAIEAFYDELWIYGDQAFYELLAGIPFQFHGVIASLLHWLPESIHAKSQFLQQLAKALTCLAPNKCCA